MPGDSGDSEYTADSADEFQTYDCAADIYGKIEVGPLSAVTFNGFRDRPTRDPKGTKRSQKECKGVPRRHKGNQRHAQGETEGTYASHKVPKKGHGVAALAVATFAENMLTLSATISRTANTFENCVAAILSLASMLLCKV